MARATANRRLGGATVRRMGTGASRPSTSSGWAPSSDMSFTLPRRGLSPVEQKIG